MTWHGENQRHSEVQRKGDLKDTLREPMISSISAFKSEATESLLLQAKYGDQEAKEILSKLTIFLNGTGVVELYHGTNRDFSDFNLSKNRTELNAEFHGDGLFLSPSKTVAEKYAHAARNAGLDVSIIEQLKQKNMQAAIFLEALYHTGDAAWTTFQNQLSESDWSIGSIDANILSDIAMWIEGSKLKNIHIDNNPLNIFSTVPFHTPDYILDDIENIGLIPPSPKTITVSVPPKKIMFTTDSINVLYAKNKGYEGVIFAGEELVDGIPEIQLFNNTGLKIVEIKALIK